MESDSDGNDMASGTAACSITPESQACAPKVDTLPLPCAAS